MTHRTIGDTWSHSLRVLDAVEGVRCSIRGCDEPATYIATHHYESVNGPWTQRQLLCQVGADEYARAHEIEVPTC